MNTNIRRTPHGIKVVCTGPHDTAGRKWRMWLSTPDGFTVRRNFMSEDAIKRFWDNDDAIGEFVGKAMKRRQGPLPLISEET